MSPHGGLMTKQSNSPRSKGSSKIVFQRNKSPKSKVVVSDQAKMNMDSNRQNVYKNDASTDDYIAS